MSRFLIGPIICTIMHTLELGSAVKRRRRELGLRQEDLAELAGCSTRFVHALEHDKPALLLDKVTDVLRVLGLSLAVVPVGVSNVGEEP
jgi:HTH-type transcriptional regulator / antitoxin HipB